MKHDEHWAVVRARRRLVQLGYAPERLDDPQVERGVGSFRVEFRGALDGKPHQAVVMVGRIFGCVRVLGVR